MEAKLAGHVSPGEGTLRRPRSRGRRVFMVLRWNDYEIIHGVSTYAREAAWIMNDPAPYGIGADFALRIKCDGIIMIPRSEIDEVTIERIMAAGVKVVCLNREMPVVDMPRIIPDNVGIGSMAAHHLLERGFRRLAYYQSDDSAVEGERMEGFRRTALEGGAEFLHFDLSGFRDPAGGFDKIIALARKLRKPKKPLGVMGQCDRTANHVVMACEQAGLSVPQDVAVVGVDNDLISSELGAVPLTSVESHRFGFGYESAALLDRLMDGDPAPAEPLLIRPRGIVVRKSTDVFAFEDDALSKALGFIRHNYMKEIGVGDVALASAVSRRKLYTLFSENLGRTVKDEIDSVRLERARTLLRETDDKLSSVAASVGMASAFQLGRLFKRLEGCTPQEYRLENSKTGND